ncbi:MAG: hypothetical protein [Bacteriophage sp.]|nr:MAG: hypothetical protein [Bacteriophage sp.]
MAYSLEEIDIIFDSILERIERGESIRDILLDSDTPSSRTFFKWLKEDEAKVKQYELAMSYRDDKLFEEIITIAYNTEEGTTTKETERGVEVSTGDMLGHRRLKIDALKWYLSKRNPKKYGDKVDVTSDGEKLKSHVTIFQLPDNGRG